MTPAQKELARHALGLPNDARRSCSNCFRTPYRPGTDTDAWFGMVEQGLAEHAIVFKGTVRFWLTPDAARAALDDGETLCPEDFPQ